MIYISQHEYDNAEPDFNDYQEEKKFGKFAEFVALELLAGRDCMGIDALIFMIDLELAAGGGYQMALEWICDRVTEDQYRSWLDDYSYELN